MASSSTFNSIQEYNKYLADNYIKLIIKDYAIKLNQLFYHEYECMSHMDFFMDLVGKVEIFIHHEKLGEYGVITTENKSSDVKRLLDQYNYKKNKDYYSSEDDEQDKLLTIQEQELRKKILLLKVQEQKKDSENEEEFLLANVAQQKKDSKNKEEFKNKDNRGGSNKIYYILHPRVFIYCLMRAKNTHIYSQYFMMINEIFKYYNDYQILLKDKLLSIKDDKIDELIKENKQQSNDIKQLLNKSDKVLNELKNTNDKLDTVLEERVIFPDKKNKLQTFSLLKLENAKEYKIIYGSMRYIYNEVKSIKKEEFEALTEELINNLSNDLTNEEREKAIKKINYTVVKQLFNKYKVLKFEKVPNCQYLRELIRENMTSSYKYDYSTIIRLNKSEKTMIKEITKIYEERKDV